MRLHHLTLCAVGPFPGRVDVDFDSFTDSGRFLLTGPTGSGKTTIIDAIVFALYNKVSQGTSSGLARIRSDYAAPTTTTEVTLVFSTDDGVYRITRSPAYERAKKRGTGTTTEQHQVVLERISSPDHWDPETHKGEVISRRVDEVQREVQRIVGLTHAQFTQTVVLPQGKFATFLTAGTEERYQLLKEVFGTHIYTSIQDKLRDYAKSARERSATQRAELGAAVDSLGALCASLRTHLSERGIAVEESAAPAEATPAEPAPGGNATPPNAPDDAARLRELVDSSRLSEQEVDTLTAPLSRALEQAISQASTDRDTCREKAAAATDLFSQAEQQAAAQRTRNELRSTLEALTQARDTHTQDVARLELAQRCHPIREADTAWLDARRAAAAHLNSDEFSPALCDGDTLRATRSLITQLSDEALITLTPSPVAQAYLAVTEALSQARDEARRAHTELRRRGGRLEETASLEAELTATEARIAAATEAHAAAQAQVTQLRTALDARPQQLARLTEQRDAAHDAHARLQALTVQVEQAKSILTAAQRVVELTAQCAKDEKAVAAARRTADSTNEKVALLRRQWIEQTAGSLSGQLTEGEPCPLCGSCDHPSPAPVTGSTITQRDLDKAEKAAATARDTLETRSRDHRQHADDLERAQHDAQGTSVEEAQAAHEELLAQHKATAALSRTRKKRDEQLAAFSEETAAISQQVDEATAQALSSAHERDTLTAAHAAATEKVTAARGDYPTVTALLEHVSAQADAQERDASACAALLQACTTLYEAREQLLGALTQVDMPTLTEARSALLSSQELSDLSSSIATYRSRYEQVTTQLATPEMQNLPEEAVDVDSARAAHTQATAALEASIKEVASLDRLQEQHLAAISSLQERLRSYTQTLAADAIYLDAADIASGKNSAHASLATWVLQERLAQVLTFANERLEHISHGRYELTHTDTTSGNTQDQGLNIAVIDHFHDGSARPTGTLSGGETFYVSLSLALALADVVSTESGGITMDTLFIDEGFGSLDPETLDNVMNVLAEIQDGGRLLGIVSHVDELKRQIPDHLAISRSANGSTLRVTGAEFNGA